MAANLFSKLERFCEESQVMAGHWSIALNDESSEFLDLKYLLFAAFSLAELGVPLPLSGKNR